jgi:hypothetical protein
MPTADRYELSREIDFNIIVCFRVMLIWICLYHSDIPVLSVQCSPTCPRSTCCCKLGFRNWRARSAQFLECFVELVQVSLCIVPCTEKWPLRARKLVPEFTSPGVEKGRARRAHDRCKLPDRSPVPGGHAGRKDPSGGPSGRCSRLEKGEKGSGLFTRSEICQKAPPPFALSRGGTQPVFFRGGAGMMCSR